MRGHGVAGEAQPAAVPKPGGPWLRLPHMAHVVKGAIDAVSVGLEPGALPVGLRGGGWLGLFIPQPAPTYSIWVRGLFLAEGTPPTAKKLRVGRKIRE